PKELGPPIRSHGDLYDGDEGYLRLLSESAAWTELHNLIYSSHFWRGMAREFPTAHSLLNEYDFKPGFREPRDVVLPYGLHRFLLGEDHPPRVYSLLADSMRRCAAFLLPLSQGILHQWPQLLGYLL